jgi:flagellar motor switch protein FliM
MTELLSNEEIDTLLELFRAEGAGLTNDEEQDLRRLSAGEEDQSGFECPEDRVRPLEILEPSGLGRPHLAALERMLHSAARGLTATWCERVDGLLRCDCLSPEQLRFVTWSRRFKGPASYFVVRQPAFRRPTLVAIENRLLYGAVDLLLGGDGRVEHVPESLTSTEYALVEHLVTETIDELCGSVRELAGEGWQLADRGGNPAVARIVSDDEVLLDVPLRFAGDVLKGEVHFLVPCAELELHLERLPELSVSDTLRQPGTCRRQLAAALERAPLTLTVRLGETRLPLRTILALREGDVVTLPTRVDAPLDVVVGNQPKFTGRVGRVGRSCAVQVSRVLEVAGDDRE